MNDANKNNKCGLMDTKSRFNYNTLPDGVNVVYTADGRIIDANITKVLTIDDDTKDFLNLVCGIKSVDKKCNSLCGISNNIQENKIISSNKLNNVKDSNSGHIVSSTPKEITIKGNIIFEGPNGKIVLKATNSKNIWTLNKNNNGLLIKSIDDIGIMINKNAAKNIVMQN